MRGKRFIFKKHFEGLPKVTDFQLIEEEIPTLGYGEVLFQAMYLSVDPYMRLFSQSYRTGETMFGLQVARVLETKNPDYRQDDVVVGYLGWTTHSVVDPNESLSPFADRGKPYAVTMNIPGHTQSIALGALGVPGYTAYLGLTKVLKPKHGEILVVSSAAGAVGSIVGQLGKIFGLKVIGFAGSDEKVKILKNELNFDYAFNYNIVNIPKVLKMCAPQGGPDLYFDNVGGRISKEIMKGMKPFGRVAVCGTISYYNFASSRNESIFEADVIAEKQLTIQCFSSVLWQESWEKAIGKNFQYLQEGKMIYKETVTQGFNKMPEAFIGLFRGKNIGKAIVAV